MIELVQAELLVELGHASAGIHQLLLAREEGVTLRADFHLDILLGRTCLNQDRKSTRLNSSHKTESRMPSSA